MEYSKMMRWLGLDPSKRSDLKDFAYKLQAGDTHVPDGWDRLVVSANEKCEWFYFKDFINRQIHGMSFEKVSLLFGDTIRHGDGMLFVDPEGTGDGVERPWGCDCKDLVVVEIGYKRRFIVRVYHVVESERVHLVSAYAVSQRVVENAVQEHSLNSSVNLMERILAGYFKERQDRRRF
jgi:hypothetical protein